MFGMKECFWNNLYTFILLTCLSISCTDRCDDCSGIGSDFFRFKIVSNAGTDLFFNGDSSQFNPESLEIFSSGLDGNENQESIGITDEYFFVDLQIGISDIFFIKYGSFLDTLRVEVKVLESDCPGCPNLEIEELRFNGELICNDCSDEILQFNSSN